MLTSGDHAASASTSGLQALPFPRRTPISRIIELDIDGPHLVRMLGSVGPHRPVGGPCPLARPGSRSLPPFHRPKPLQQLVIDQPALAPQDPQDHPAIPANVPNFDLPQRMPRLVLLEVEHLPPCQRVLLWCPTNRQPSNSDAQKRACNKTSAGLRCCSRLSSDTSQRQFTSRRNKIRLLRRNLRLKHRRLNLCLRKTQLTVPLWQRQDVMVLQRLILGRGSSAPEMSSTACSHTPWWCAGCSEQRFSPGRRGSVPRAPKRSARATRLACRAEGSR